MGIASESASRVVLASASRTTTQTSDDLAVSARSIEVRLNMTVVGTGSVTVAINGKDLASGTYYNLLTGAAVVTNSMNRYKVSPHLTAAANATAQDIVPDVVQIVVTANNANPATYSVTLTSCV